MRSTGAILMTAATLVGAPAVARAQTADAPAFYQRACAQCHDAGINRAPQRDALLTMTAERVLAAVEAVGP